MFLKTWTWGGCVGRGARVGGAGGGGVRKKEIEFYFNVSSLILFIFVFQNFRPFHKFFVFMLSDS